MKRLVPFIATAVLLAACGSSGEVVATVNGVDITVSEVEVLRGGDPGAVSREVFNEDLRNAIVEVLLIEAAASDFGISFTSEEIEAKLAEIKTDIELQTGVTYQEFLDQQGFSDERIRRIANQQLVAGAVEDELANRAGAVSEADLQAVYDNRILQFTEACVSHILLATEEEAAAARDRVENGEDFGAVAAEVSIDPSAAENRGELGCYTLAGYVSEFAVAANEAVIGEVTEPVQTEFGFHLIRVDSRAATPLDEVADVLTAELKAAQSSAAFSDWLFALVGDAEVEINPEYGTWVTDPVPQILPPE